MNNTKVSTRIIGICYLLATATAMTGFNIFESLTAGTDYLSSIYPSRIQLSLGVLFQIINDAAVVTIGVLFYQLLKKHNNLVAGTVLTTRAIEGAVLLLGKIGILLLIPLSKSFIHQSGVDASVYELLAKLTQDFHYWSFVLGMFPLGIGGIVLSYFLFKTSMVPKIIAFMGIVGYIFLFSKSIADILGYETDFWLFMPGALFELIFPLWIILKGFNWDKLNTSPA